MSINKSNSRKSFEKGHGKNKSFKSQEKTILYFLQKNTSTATMVTDATGIKQKNICRAKRNLEKSGQLQEVERKLCKSSGFKAWYLTTNKELFKTNYLR